MSEFEKLKNAAKGSKLTEKKTEVTGSQAKHLNKLPSRYVEAHRKLKSDGMTSLDLSSYIYEALREKLERDNAL
ncbi:hypothetical protein [Pseudoalteromonas sp. MMG024]|uniref:hypothetical protein n=1 Tax=Pseudoalteromonas sp. MMG024 TaxID=2909980 RepID=UPI001F2214C1|nr:hypothetical protein [Pseudoalteromonas sp. MMG024]MCF6459097.1 hypothetical protein [Pseudoalteromonas sp. MMG024]